MLMTVLLLASSAVWYMPPTAAEYEPPRALATVESVMVTVLPPMAGPPVCPPAASANPPRARVMTESLTVTVLPNPPIPYASLPYPYAERLFMPTMLMGPGVPETSPIPLPAPVASAPPLPLTVRLPVPVTVRLAEAATAIPS